MYIYTHIHMYIYVYVHLYIDIYKWDYPIHIVL